MTRDEVVRDISERFGDDIVDLYDLLADRMKS